MTNFFVGATFGAATVMFVQGCLLVYRHISGGYDGMKFDAEGVDDEYRQLCEGE